MQDITPQSLGKLCPASLVWVRAHCSSRFPVIRAAQEICAMLLRFLTRPCLAVRGKEALGCL